MKQAIRISILMFGLVGTYVAVSYTHLPTLSSWAPKSRVTIYVSRNDLRFEFLSPPTVLRFPCISIRHILAPRYRFLGCLEHGSPGGSNAYLRADQESGN